MIRSTILLLICWLFFVSGQYEDYYGDYGDENPLENMPFFIVPEANLTYCSEEKIKERVDADPDAEFTDELLEPIRGDPVLQTCSERYEAMHEEEAGAGEQVCMCVQPPKIVLDLLEDAGIELEATEHGFFAVCGNCNDDKEWEPVLDDVEYTEGGNEVDTYDY